MARRWLFACFTRFRKIRHSRIGGNPTPVGHVSTERELVPRLRGGDAVLYIRDHCQNHFPAITATDAQKQILFLLRHWWFGHVALGQYRP
jgi:hypothetical protein